MATYNPFDPQSDHESARLMIIPSSTTQESEIWRQQSSQDHQARRDPGLFDKIMGEGSPKNNCTTLERVSTQAGQAVIFSNGERTPHLPSPEQAPSLGENSIFGEARQKMMQIQTGGLGNPPGLEITHHGT